MDPGFDHWRKGAFLPGFQAAGAAFIVYGEWKFGGMFSNPEAGVTEGAGGGEEVTTISVDKIFFFKMGCLYVSAPLLRALIEILTETKGLQFVFSVVLRRFFFCGVSDLGAF